MNDWLSLSWKVMLGRGALGIVFGVLALVWPGLTVVAFVVIWGVWATVDGVSEAIAAFSTGLSAGQRALHGAMALIGLFAGFFALVRPGVAAVTITWVLGIWLVARGLISVAAGFSVPDGKALVFASAALDVLLGVLLVANPGRSAVAIVWVLGLTAIAWGVVLVVAGFMTRKQLDRRPTADPATH